MASPLQIISAAPPKIHVPEIICIAWNDPTAKFHVPLRANDDMPVHVRGDAQWLEGEGIWNYYIHDEDGGLWLVAFFNNNWWLLSIENGEAKSRVDWRILRGRYSLGWWNINDPQHPDYKQLELISPRDPQLEVPSNEEEEFHPANPP